MVKSKLEVDEFKSELIKLEKEHWERLEKYGYVEFPETDGETCYDYTVGDLRIESHHEQNDCSAILTFISWLLEEE